MDTKNKEFSWKRVNPVSSPIVIYGPNPKTLIVIEKKYGFLPPKEK